MAESPATPDDQNGEENVDERSEAGDDTMLDGTPADQDSEIKGERFSNGRQFVEADEPTDYSLFSNPTGLGAIRQRLFDVENTIEMSQSDFDSCFPFVDNVWRKSKSGEATKENDEIVDIYWCRRRKANSGKPYTPKPTPEGKTSRKKRARDETTCPMTIKVVRKEGLEKKCIVQRMVGPEVRHTHNLDFMDSVKRNSGIMDVARREATRAFLPGSVYWKMQEEPDKMEAAGGKYMKISDVRNVQYHWRQENPNMMLKAHHGYSQANKGPKPKDHNMAQATPPPPPPHPPPSSQPRDSQQFQPQHLPGKLHYVPTTAHPAAPIPGPPPATSNVYGPSALHQPQPSHQQPLIQPQPAPHPHHAHHSSHIPQGLPPPATLDNSARLALQYPDHAKEFLDSYVPKNMDKSSRPHITLTWATSLDARISMMPNVQTAISGPETKAMTHYLRSRHDAIIIGVKTAIADDPSLNCRLAGSGGYGGPQFYQQPRPVIIDPNARLHIHPEMKVLKVVTEGRAKAPWIVVTPAAKLHPTAIQTLRSFGGEYLMIHDVDPQTGRLSWEAIFNVLFKEDLKSIMIEGGGQVLSELLKPRYNNWIDSIILTIAPAFFGRTGVEVSPEATYDSQTRQPIASRLRDVRWQPMGDVDVVMCGHLRYDPGQPNGLLPGIQEISQQPVDPRGQYQPTQNGHQEVK